MEWSNETDEGDPRLGARVAAGVLVLARVLHRTPPGPPVRDWRPPRSEQTAERSEQSSELLIGPTPEPPVCPGVIVARKYLVQGVIAHGGMGIICAGLHVDLEQPVAIKLMRRALARDPDLVDRFLNEARATASLKSPHVVRVLDVGQLPDGLPYLVMERLVGVDLDTLAYERGALPPGEAVEYVLQACEALSEAHALGIIHRDIKPENLFVTRGPHGRKLIKLLDFGVAKRLGVHRRVMTETGHTVGSPWYMSPEQMSRPNEVDARSDIWSVGVVLFRLLTGHLPFDGDTIAEVCARVLEAPTPDPLSLRPDLDPVLAAVVERCLCKHREARYRSADALAESLAPFAAPASATRALPRSVPPAVASVADLKAVHRPAFARRSVRAAGPWFAAVAAALGSAVTFAGPDSGPFALDGLIEGWLATASMESDAPLSDAERQERKALPLMPRGFVFSGRAEASAEGLQAEMEPGIVDVTDAVAPDVASSAQPSREKRRRFRAPRTKTTDEAAAETRAVPNETASNPLQLAKQSNRSAPGSFEPMLK